MPLTEDQEGRLGAVVDRLENALHGTKLPLPSDFHLTQLKEVMRTARDDARALYVELHGEDPWKTNQPTG